MFLTHGSDLFTSKVALSSIILKMSFGCNTNAAPSRSGCFCEALIDRLVSAVLAKIDVKFGDNSEFQISTLALTSARKLMSTQTLSVGEWMKSGRAEKILGSNTS